MNIAKALKTKNRIAGELSRAKAIFSRENSHRVGDKRACDPAALLAAVNQAQEDLIKIKTAIALASAPISERLVRMGELKSRMAWLSEIPIREGVQRDRFAGEKAEAEVWEAHFATRDRDNEVEELQKAINALQDEIDDFNATTQVVL